jgi:hypothetical protein
MMTRAVEVASALSRTLAAEVERARVEREVLRTLDAQAVFASAARRSAFNTEVARLGEELSGALRACAAELGGELSMARLAARFPAEAEDLRRAVAEIRGHAATLARLDQLNRMIAGRALAFVNGYLGVLRPAPSAYDRRGARAAHAAAGGFSSKV